MYSKFIFWGCSMSALQEAIQKVGGVTKAAKACGITPRAMYKWLSSGSLPRTEYTGETSYAQKLAAASGGAFNADWLLQQASPSTRTAA